MGTKWYGWLPGTFSCLLACLHDDDGNNDDEDILISPPKPIRRHHHLTHQAVLNAQFGIYLYRRRALARGWAAGCWAGVFDALDVDLWG